MLRISPLGPNLTRAPPRSLVFKVVAFGGRTLSITYKY